MRLHFDVDGLRPEPSGCLAGASWIYFRWSAALSGIVLFGAPDRTDAEGLARALTLEFEPSVAPHAFYVDAQRLKSADPDAFAQLIAIYDRHHARAAKFYTRLVLIVPPGVPGAVVAGFHGGRTPPFPTEAFSDVDAARAFVDAPPALVTRLTELVAERTGAAAIVLRLRTLLDHESTAETLARALGLSDRTLQRRLAESGTTLQTEITRHRIELAKRKLSDTATPITIIALDLGFSTSQHFSRTFRAATGVAPTAWRQRARSPRRAPRAPD